jgi:uncharacterized membrane protein YdbT with pleckstrin-like domain
MSRLRLFNAIYGIKPRRDAPRMERLLWFRGYYLRNLPLAVVAIGALALFLSASQWWIAVVVMLPWVVGFARLNVEIRSEKRRAAS